MNTLTKFTLGLMGQLRPKPPRGDATPAIALPPPNTHGGMPLMDALASRHSAREFSSAALPLQILSDLLWVGFGVNRPEQRHRTAPSAIDAQEIDLYVALPQGAYLYDAFQNSLRLIVSQDLRRITGYQDFVDDAPLDLVMVANYDRLKLVPSGQRECFASVAAGAIAQNIYLFAASAGLSTVIRAWIDRSAIASALGLNYNQHVLLSQTVGYPRLKPTITRLD